MATIQTEARTIDNGNGHLIFSYWYRPAGTPRGAVLVAPAMAVEQRFYADFAGWLAEQGFLAVTFDYLGTGLSRRVPLRQLDVDVLDWARHDASAVLAEVAEAASDLPLYWIGHSVGAQILPLVKGHERLTRIVTIAAGSGYWRENSPQIRRKAWLLWHGLAPVLTALAGYFPGGRIGAVGDLPAGVIRQWRRWCLHPEYLVGVEGDPVRHAFDAVRTPLTSLSFTDDEMMSARNTESLHGFYTSAPKNLRRIAPSEIGVDRIGHFGFFRKSFAPTLWLRWLLPELAPEESRTVA
ncbi:alpha/beta hydrolase [Pseudomonas sp. MTM4]|uniref:alpha/beta hydrolase family protein n=1 Tax=unclassified Pseudomonas TaxID=196821 RepID=UPI0018D1FC86|nr:MULTISPECIES: alpha/beta hydrolase [unclassified Pseudomonas]MBC8650133.1 alpha/beta hydrolase [Pseudomonas sp. MT4]QXY92456.1 alpha/beta hydrolase [Pseudomonas sp. MTM4]